MGSCLHLAAASQLSRPPQRGAGASVTPLRRTAWWGAFQSWSLGPRTFGTLVHIRAPESALVGLPRRTSVCRPGSSVSVKVSFSVKTINFCQGSVENSSFHNLGRVQTVGSTAPGEGSPVPFPPLLSALAAAECHGGKAGEQGGPTPPGRL